VGACSFPRNRRAIRWSHIDRDQIGSAGDVPVAILRRQVERPLTAGITQSGSNQSQRRQHIEVSRNSQRIPGQPEWPSRLMNRADAATAQRSERASSRLLSQLARRLPGRPAIKTGTDIQLFSASRRDVAQPLRPSAGAIPVVRIAWSPISNFLMKMPRRAARRHHQPPPRGVEFRRQGSQAETDAKRLSRRQAHSDEAAARLHATATGSAPVWMFTSRQLAGRWLDQQFGDCS